MEALGSFPCDFSCMFSRVSHANGNGLLLYALWTGSHLSFPVLDIDQKWSLFAPHCLIVKICVVQLLTWLDSVYYSWSVHQLEVGTRHNFWCRGPNSNPRPVLDSSRNTTRGMIIRLFQKLKTCLFEYSPCLGVFRGVLGRISALWAQNWFFTESELDIARIYITIVWISRACIFLITFQETVVSH